LASCLAGTQVLKLAFLFGLERLWRLAGEVGLGRDPGRLLQRLLLLLELRLGVFDHAANRVELAQTVEHLLQLVGNRLLVLRGVVQGQLGRILGRLARLLLTALLRPVLLS
jgi:hypothetical protein